MMFVKGHFSGILGNPIVKFFLGAIKDISNIIVTLEGVVIKTFLIGAVKLPPFPVYLISTLFTPATPIWPGFPLRFEGCLR